MATPVKTLDAKRYAETFAVFVRRSHEYPAMNQRLIDAAASLPEGFSCLDVGAGTGKVLSEWIDRGGRRPQRYWAVEPNARHARELRATCERLGLEAKVDEAGFHDRYPIEASVDLALFSHSLYWLKDPAACIAHAERSLTTGGRLIAFVQGPYAIHSIHHLFEHAFERDEPPGPDHGFSSAELLEQTRRMGLNPEVILDPTPHDLTGLFDDEHESELQEYLSFCLQVEFARVDEPLRTDIVEYLRAGCVRTGGRLLWHAPNATVIFRMA